MEITRCCLGYTPTSSETTGPSIQMSFDRRNLGWLRGHHQVVAADSLGRHRAMSPATRAGSGDQSRILLHTRFELAWTVRIKPSGPGSAYSKSVHGV